MFLEHGEWVERRLLLWRASRFLAGKTEGILQSLGQTCIRFSLVADHIHKAMHYFAKITLTQHRRINSNARAEYVS